MCARELRSGREIRLWENELRQLSAAPFNVGPDSVMLTYAAAAELSCFLELGWPTPRKCDRSFRREHRVATNRIPCRAATVCWKSPWRSRGLAHIDAGEKEEMRHRIISQTEYSDTDRTELLAYCMSDNDAMAALLPALTIDVPFALLRGRYRAQSPAWSEQGYRSTSSSIAVSSRTGRS